MNKLIENSNLLSETNELKKPKLWKKFVDREIDWLKIYEKFILNLQNSVKIPSININVNHAVKPWLKSKIFDHQVTDFTNLEDWFMKWLEDENFCVLFDRITDYSEDIFDLLGTEVISALGDKSFSIGADSYAIFGNYGYTPFGIHLDNEPIFLIHCGPGNKELWFWEDKPDDKYLGRTDILEVNSDWKKNAIHVVLEPGDMIFIPSQMYHLLYTGDFSVTLGTALFPNNASSLIRTGISNLPILNPKNDEIIVTWSDTESIKSQFNKYLIEDFGFNYFELGEAVFEGLIDQQNKLKSNGSFIGSPFINLDKDINFMNCCFKLKSNIKIPFREKNGELVIYLRGRICKIGYNTYIEKALNLINTKPKFSFNNLLEVLEDENVVYKLLKLFYEYRSIDVACRCKLGGNPKHV